MVLGNASIMDDLTLPSLLAAPYLGYCDVNDSVSSHTSHCCYKILPSTKESTQVVFPEVLIPSIAISIAPIYQGLTATDKAERKILARPTSCFLW